MVHIKECSASSETENWECRNVYGKDTGWESLNNDTSPWIKLNLEDEYELQQLKIQTTGGIKKFAQILIEFSDGSNQSEKLESYDSWNVITLPKIHSRFIKIARITSFGSNTEGGGISKIKASGCPTGKFIILQK